MMKYALDDVHYQALAAMSPEEVCRRAGCNFDEVNKVYSLKVWGVEYTVSLESKSISASEKGLGNHDYFFVFLINYLQMAKERKPSGEWISEKDLSGGTTFFRGPHLIPTHCISDMYKNDIESFSRRCRDLGGAPVNMGDAAFSFTITPSIPLLAIYWLGDEDFPSEAKILYDRSMRNYLPLDIVYALAVEACYRLGTKGE